MGIFYDKIEAAVFYGPESISGTALPPLYQEKRSSTTMGAIFSAIAAYVDPNVGNAIAKERSNSGVVTFNARMVAWVRFKSGAWTTRRHMIRAYCDNIRIGFSNSTALTGSLQGPATTCHVDT